ncbi:gluconokinase [Deinococcus cellulosilyticus]|uniref:Gluconate kinase n=1 Tax=Deinococcus cellulosilyticus (strain DSM 18568 / NBRC 106333 / KACC 11606 / 5516J-15) TaxID=1223518 RepID=A0A511N2L0_DEIC1|nr:gluconokinase [Deinococcus cellulosilyticus]GEM46747.1 gluconate kinase [Deinococcus cellulosilyticus NBRC 106333 = KACC 11606]
MYIRSEPIVLSIDIGSSSVKGLAYDQNGQALPGIRARVSCGLSHSDDGGAEANLARITQAVDQVLDALHVRSGSREVLGVAFTSIASSLVALDRHQQPVLPVLTYADTRSVPALGQLQPDPGRVNRTGCPDYTAYWTAQIPWWRSAFGMEATTWCNIADHVLWRYFGGTVRTSYSLASWTGLLNRHLLRWDPDLLNQLHLSEDQLPLLDDHTAAHRHLGAEYAHRWPKFAHIPFFPALGDGAAANVGSAATRMDTVALTVGTTSALRAVVPSRLPSIPAGLWSYLVDEDHALLGGALTEGGNIHQWMRESLNLGPWNELEKRVAEIEPDSHGLTFVPSFSGERSPNYNPQATGTLHGLKLSTHPHQIVRAGMEGIAYRLADIARRLRPSLGAAPTYVASGQAILSSNLWLQMLSDVLGAPVVVTDVPDEATARGAALMALKALNILDPFELPERMVTAAFEPRPHIHDIYQQALRRQMQLIEALTPRNQFSETLA